MNDNCGTCGKKVTRGYAKFNGVNYCCRTCYDTAIAKHKLNPMLRYKNKEV